MPGSAMSGKRGGRGWTLGPRSRLVAAMVTALALAAVAVGLVTTIDGSSPPAVQSPKDYTTKYGTIPSWIPNAIPKAAKAPLATLQRPVSNRPAGFSVRVVLPLGMSTVTGAGPAIPAWASQHASAIGASNVVPVKFEVRFHGTTGSVPLSAGSFSIQTAHGTVTPKVSLAGRGGLPAKVPVGQNVTLWLSTSLVQGPGVIRWTPQGKSPIVDWQYTFDLD